MSDQEIAEKMVEIVDEFQRQTGMPDEVADNVVRHCFRKMELIDAPAEYILLLLPDELKNACFRTGFGYVSHFATCPNARSHRR